MFSNGSEIVLLHKLKPILLLPASPLNEVVASELHILRLPFYNAILFFKTVQIKESAGGLQRTLSSFLHDLRILPNLFQPLQSRFKLSALSFLFLQNSLFKVHPER